MSDVLVLAGSRSDERIVKKVTDTLDALKVSYQVEYASAHREPERVKQIVQSSNSSVIIAIAGLAAALPGFVASLTERPVIGVPVSAALGGLDALLSIAQMPKGVPVATVGIDNGQNAAHLAARILRLSKREQETVPTTYAQAGVDESLVSKGITILSKYVRDSFRGHDVGTRIGHYANMVRIEDDLFIAMSTDGVGSKVLVAELMDRYESIAKDCVAMNVNDLICVGATPVGFVDYIACSRPLPDHVLEQIGRGLAEACEEAGIPILGGETAILPDIIKGHGDVALDLAGTAVGTVRSAEIVDGKDIEPGDVILGVASNGLHSNGYTLARKVLLHRHSPDEALDWGPTLGEELLRPTEIYVPHFKALKKHGIRPRGLAHITGSAFRKILRLGPHHYRITELPQPPPIFEMIRREASIEWAEMFTTFNMGIGLVVIVSAGQADDALEVLRRVGSGKAWRIGVVDKAEDGQTGRVTIEQYGVVIG